jgi:hypothetical protein
MTIRRSREVPQLAGPFSHASQHRVAVRDRFVPWRFDSAGKVFRRMNDLFFHAAILARQLLAPVRIARTPHAEVFVDTPTRIM